MDFLINGGFTDQPKGFQVKITMQIWCACGPGKLRMTWVFLKARNPAAGKS